MKSYVIFSLILLNVLFFNEAYGEEYQNNEFNFKIDLPEDWVIGDGYPLTHNKELQSEFIEYPVNFFQVDITGRWSAMLQIRNIDSGFYEQYKTNDEGMQLLENLIQRDCDNYSINFDGFVCIDVEIIESSIFEIDNESVFQLKYNWTERNAQNIENYNTSIARFVTAENGLWLMYSETYSETFPSLENEILMSMDSFQILDDNEIIDKESVEPNDILSQVEKLDKKADELFFAGKPEQAIYYYNKALKLDPNTPNTFDDIHFKSPDKSKYIVKHFSELRSSSGELLAAREGLVNRYFPHQITDMFLESYQVREIVTIDDKKYELRMIRSTPIIPFEEDLIQHVSHTFMKYHGITVFAAVIPSYLVDEGEVLTGYWEVYRQINE